MKKYIFLLLGLLAAIIFSCDKEEIVTVTVTGISLNTEKTVIEIGESETLVATVSPSDAPNNKVLWSSSDNSIASVNNGVVTGISVGKATISAITDEGGLKAACTVEVLDNIIHVSGIKFQDEKGSEIKKLNLVKGGSKKMLTKISPDNATVTDVKFSTSNDSILSVNEEGEILALAVGKAAVIATTIDGGITASCDVQISSPVQQITLQTDTLTLKEYDTYKLNYTLDPADSDTRLEWSSDNKNIVEVVNGVLYARKVEKGKENKAIITVRSSIDEKVCAKCTVTVVCDILGIKIESPELYVVEGDTVRAKAETYPARATGQGLIWSSENDKIAKVDENGIITGVTAGETNIVVKTEDGKHEAKCQIHVISKVTGISLEPTTYTMKVGSSYTLKAKLTPENATVKDIKWTSNNPEIVTVDEKGKITAQSVGNTVIIASSVDGGITASCEVKVTSALKKLTFDPDEIEVYEGASTKLNLLKEPADATDVDITWESKDSTKVQVVNGTVVALKSGETTIIASCGNITAKCKVSVIANVTGVKLDKTELSLERNNKYTLKATVLPEGVPEKDWKLEWESSNDNVAEIAQNGTVTAKSSGTATITVYAANRKFKATCQVSVTTPVESFSIKSKTDSLFVGDADLELEITDIKPNDADPATFVWKSSDETTAYVNPDNGKVSAKSPGEVTVTASVKGNDKVKAEKKITILRHATEVKIEPAALNMKKGSSQDLKITVLPDDAYNKKIKSVKSEDSKIARVSIDQETNTYIVNAVAAGTTKITATAEDGKITGECTVTVTDEIKVTGVTLDKTALELNVGSTTLLKATVAPADATNQKVSWESDNKAVATVNADGLVTAVSGGTAKITVTTDDGGKTATCEVTVKVPVESITPAETSLEMKIGDKHTVNVTIKPDNASNKQLNWFSKDESIASVNESTGEIKANKVGETTITVKTTDGSNLSKDIKVKVTDNVIHVTGVELSSHAEKLEKGSNITLTATVNPTTATNKTVTWNSSNPDVASVKDDGLKATITAKTTGTATITVTTADGSKTDNCTITVIDKIIHVTGVELSKHAETLEKGTNLTLTATVSPSTATDKTVKWTSSDTNVATVTPDGLSATIAAKANGTATITVTTKDEELTDECTITVIDKIIHVTGIQIQSRTISVPVNGSVEVYADIYPANATNKEVYWTQSSGQLGYVLVEKGRTEGNRVYATFKGLKAGKSTVFVGSEDKSSGTIEDNCAVTVTKVAVTSIELDKTAISLKEGKTATLNATVLPDNASYKTVTWKSDNATVATVDENGIVTAKKKGEAHITATSTDDSTKKATCTVKVTSSEIDDGTAEGLEFTDL